MFDTKFLMRFKQARELNDLKSIISGIDESFLKYPDKKITIEDAISLEIAGEAIFNAKSRLDTMEKFPYAAIFETLKMWGSYCTNIRDARNNLDTAIENFNNICSKLTEVAPSSTSDTKTKRSTEVSRLTT